MKMDDDLNKLALEAFLRGRGASGGSASILTALQHRTFINQSSVTVSQGTPAPVVGPTIFTPIITGKMLIVAFSSGIASTSVTGVTLAYQDDSSGSMVTQNSTFASGIPQAGLAGNAFVSGALVFLYVTPKPVGVTFSIQLLATVGGAGGTYQVLANGGAIFLMELP